MTNELAIITVNFNTPEYIKPLVSSLKKSNPWVNTPVTVFDNSTINKLSEGSYNGYVVKHVPDYIYQDINNLPPSKYPAAGSYNSARHAITLQYALSLIDSDFCLIADSDIVFTVNFSKLFDTVKRSNSFMCGYERTTYTHRAIAPWCCILNMNLYRKYGMKYYDSSRMIYINDLTDYDTGASILEDAERFGFNIIKTPDNLYWVHFKGGSVFKQAGINWLNKNKHLWA